MQSLIITCEHAGNDVPEQYDYIFPDRQVLATHRGWDPGALEIANFLNKRFNAPLFINKLTRLLVELNRSLESSQLFSEFSMLLSDADRKVLIDTVYLPYRASVEEIISEVNKAVLHLSIHSFTPVMDSVERTTDIGILFDPGRELESSVSMILKEYLSQNLQGLTIDFNKPYAGVDDGFTTYLRTRFPDEEYAGIELEINQKFVGTDMQQRIQEAIGVATENLLRK